MRLPAESELIAVGEALEALAALSLLAAKDRSSNDRASAVGRVLLATAPVSDRLKVPIGASYCALERIRAVPRNVDEPGGVMG